MIYNMTGVELVIYMSSDWAHNAKRLYRLSYTGLAIALHYF